ncbi:MAG: hypothetical protein JWO92_2210 [Chitinophagaceae bacterium]|nr:hypothetical protein [Chitinophagaceae bacterium]
MLTAIIFNQIKLPTLLRQSFIVFILLFVFNSSSIGQQMVQTPKEAKILEENESEFIGKTLNDLFKEIKPQINLVLARPGWAEAASTFTFFFTSKKEFNQFRLKDKWPLHVRVYIQGTFEWERHNRTQDNYLDWTKDDKKRYGNLIIGAIRVFNGDELPTDSTHIRK